MRDSLNVLVERPVVYSKCGRLASGQGDEVDEGALNRDLRCELRAEIYGLI
jgi:hypothetical protein